MSMSIYFLNNIGFLIAIVDNLQQIRRQPLSLPELQDHNIRSFAVVLLASVLYGRQAKLF